MISIKTIEVLVSVYFKVYKIHCYLTLDRQQELEPQVLVEGEEEVGVGVLLLQEPKHIGIRVLTLDGQPDTKFVQFTKEFVADRCQVEILFSYWPMNWGPRIVIFIIFIKNLRRSDKINKNEFLWIISITLALNERSPLATSTALPPDLFQTSPVV